MRAATTNVVPDDLPPPWVYADEYLEHTPRDKSPDYIPFAYGGKNHYQGKYYTGISSVGVTKGDGVPQPAVATQNTEAVPTSGVVDHTEGVRRLLEDPCVITSGESRMTLMKMRVCICGLINL